MSSPREPELIVKLSKGTGFRGATEYLLRQERGAIVGGNMAGRTPRELAHEFGQLRKLRPTLGKAVAHFSLSLPPDDRRPDDTEWAAIAERFLKDMKFLDEDTGLNCPFVVVRHDDTAHHHIHVLTSRVGFTNSGEVVVVADKNDYRRAEAAVRRIEADYGFRAVPAPTKKTNHNKRRSTMNDTTTPPSNPFEPGEPHGEVWPEGFEPGRDLAELGMIESIEGIVVASASVGEELPERRHRDMRRLTVEKDYEPGLRQLFGDELATVYKHPGGAVLYFRSGKGRIADAGSKLTALGDMPEHQAAVRIVAIAKARGWPSITFTGTPKFVELAMREAMAHGTKIVAKGDEQAALLAKLIAEKQGGMGAMAGPSIEADPILAPLAELDDLPAQTLPRTAPAPAPVAPPPASPEPQPPRPPFVGVFPAFPNLRERIKERRDRLAHSQPRPTEPVPPQPFKRRQP